MALKRQTFDNGTQGIEITAANSGTSGDALSTIVKAGTGMGIYKTAAALRGAKGAHVTGILNDTFSLILSNASSASGSAQLYFRIISYPTANGAFFRLRSSTGNVCIFHLNTSGVLALQNNLGTGLKNFMSNTPLPLNTTYILNLSATPNASTSAGYISGYLYDLQGYVLDSYSSSAVNAGTTLDVQTAHAGKVVTGSDGFDMYIDEFAFNTGASDRIAVPYFRQNTAEGGTDGTTVTTGNSGGASGDAFNTVDTGLGAVTFSSAIKHNGQYSYAIAPVTGNSTTLDYAFSALENISRMSTRLYFYLTGAPSTGTQWVYIANADRCGCIGVSGTGRAFVQDNVGTLNTNTTALPLNTWLRVELTVTVGATTSDGSIVANIYDNDTSTSLYSYSNAACNTTISPIFSIKAGKASNSGSWATMYLDDFTVNDAPLSVPINTTVAPWIFV